MPTVAKTRLARGIPAAKGVAWADPNLSRILWVDRAAARLSGQRERLAGPLARVARSLVSQRLWNVFGHARLEDHACERYGRTARWVRDLSTLGDALERLPGLEAALIGADGRSPIGRSAAVLVARSASPRSLHAWVQLARSVSVRALRSAVRHARREGSEWPVETHDLPKTRQQKPKKPKKPTQDDPESDDSPRSELELVLPRGLRVAFDETLDLHRATCGRQVGLTSFVEALVAESWAGPTPTVDVVQVPLKRGRTIDAIECELARTASDWTWLDRELPELPARPRDPLFERLRERSSRLIAAAEHLARDAGRGSPGQIDRQLRDLVRLEDRIERQLGRLMSYLGRKRAWLRLQFSGVGHYADHRLGVSRRTAQDRTRAARELSRFPLLGRAYESGELGLEAVLLILRLLAPGPALPSIERAWVRHAMQVSIKRLRDEVRVTRREHVYGLRNHGPAPLSDEAWARALCLFPGTTQRRFARLVGVAQGTARIESCALLWMRLPEPLATDFLSTIEGRRLHLEALARTSSNAKVTPERDAPGADTPTPLAARAARTFSVRGRPVPTWVGLMALLEDYLTTWDDPALQTPRAENRIHSRHGWRCSAPGCTGRRNLEAHHIEYRSRGGSDDPSNLITLCRFHHQRGEHGDLAACQGRAPTGVEWRLGRDDVAVHYRNERRTESCASLAPGADLGVDKLVGVAS